MSGEDSVDQPADQKKDKKKPLPMAERLLSYITEKNCQLFHDQYGMPFARIKVDSHWEVCALNSTQFTLWLRHIFWQREGKTLYGDGFKKAFYTLESKALFECEKIVLANRATRYDDAIWYDLCDETHRAVKITSEGWKVIEEPPILFRRYKHQQEVPEPDSSGKVADIIQFLGNTRDDEQKFLLLISILSCFIPDIPRPLLCISGEKGSSKSTLSRMLRRIVDPAKPMLLTLPSDRSELAQQLSHHYFPFYDNISYISGSVSDSLCRAVTGDGFSKRQLYTDDEDVIFEYRRCIGLNGINVVVQRPDLLDRSILIDLLPVRKEERLTEEQVWQEFDDALPKILGFIFNTVSVSLREKPKVTVDELPRMADFAMWGCAIARGMGVLQDEFLKAYTANIAQQNAEAVHGNPLASAVFVFMEDREEFEDTPSALLDELQNVAFDEKIDMRASAWPKGPQVLLRRLKEVQANLQAVGIQIRYGQVTNGRRFITLQKTATDTATTATKDAVEENGSCDSCNVQTDFEFPDEA